MQTEYSGPFLAIIEVAHWLDLVLILGLCAMFWHTSVVGMAILVAASLFTEIVIDNITAGLPGSGWCRKSPCCSAWGWPW